MLNIFTFDILANKSVIFKETIHIIWCLNIGRRLLESCYDFKKSKKPERLQFGSVHRPESEFKEFELRLKFKPRLKYGWFNLNLY